jgi:LysW-gamma-L-lysine carboxypeptidase
LNDHEAVDLLLRLVSIPSLTGSEGAATRFIADTFRAHGLWAEIDTVGNVIGRTESGPLRLTFLGHIDTVAGEVAPRIENECVFGRGAVDAKGPLAMAVVSAIRAREVRGLEIIGAVGEEGPSHGARHLGAGTPADALVIGEPSGSDSIVLGYKGSMRATFVFTAAMAHSAGPAATVCDTAVEAWTAVRHACTAFSNGEAAFDQLTPTLLAFESGTDGMQAEARLEANFRLPPSLNLTAAQTRIRDAVYPGTAVFGHAELAYRAPRDTPLVASFVRSIRDESLRPRFKVKTGTSDMNVVAPVWCCPTLAYGPGDSSLDHTPHENVPIEEYLRGIRVLTRVFHSWGAA